MPGLKPKDLVGIPWRVALALQEDGWWLRSDIIWAKTNAMPESVKDRPTKAHEYIFLLTKSDRYFWAYEEAKEPAVRDASRNLERVPGGERGRTGNAADLASNVPWENDGSGRNMRSVWWVTNQPFPEAHFATFPPTIPENCIRAGTEEGDLVLDPFCGAGTTGLVALRMNRRFVGIELNPEYAAMAERRLREDAPLLNSVQLEEAGG